MESRWPSVEVLKSHKERPAAAQAACSLLRAACEYPNLAGNVRKRCRKVGTVGALTAALRLHCNCVNAVDAASAAILAVAAHDESDWLSCTAVGGVRATVAVLDRCAAGPPALVRSACDALGRMAHFSKDGWIKGGSAEEG